MFESLFLWLLLPLGFALGWYWRRRPGASLASGEGRPATRFAGEGLVEGDESLALLIEATSGDSRRGVLQLQLGTLFRKRGEVDRALRLHQALVESQTPGSDEALAAGFELALDYVSAGVFDRAETLLLELADSGFKPVEALETLRGLYEQSRDWGQAYDIHQRLQAVAGRDERVRGSHYACELAEQAVAGAEPDAARRWASTAVDLALDHPSARPWLLTARLQIDSGQTHKAIQSLVRASEHDPRFVSEVLAPLKTCFESLGDIDGYLAQLGSLAALDVAKGPPSSLVLEQIKTLERSGAEGMTLMVQAFSRRPTWVLLEALVERISLAPEHPLAEALRSLETALRQAAKQTPRYRCESCGLKPGKLLWQCPSCRNWGSILPVDDAIAV